MANRVKKVVPKERAIYTEEFYDLKEKAKSKKDSPIKREVFRVNDKTVILIKKNKSEKQKQRIKNLYKDQCDPVVKLRKEPYNYER